jgi:hypothetical protein
MGHIPGQFVPLDIHYLRDPSIRRAGGNAELLYIRSLVYAKSAESDGFVPDFDLSTVGVGLQGISRRVEALVREHLWIEVPGGWRIRSWEKWNKTKSQVKADKEVLRDAAIKGNHERWHVGSGKKDPRCPHCLPDRGGDRVPDRVRIAEVEVEPEREVEPEPEPEKAGGDSPTRRSAGGADAPTQALVGEWIDHCDARPPSRVIGQLSKEIKALLSENIPYEDVRRGVAAWHAKALHPSTLASVVHETRNPRTTHTDRQAELLRSEMTKAQAADARQQLEIGA